MGNRKSGKKQKAAELTRAAQYVRMSTDHQKYSIPNQSRAIAAFAVARGMKIVRTYADEGKSGLNIERREALKQLISDVQNGRADFATILVYDVSRWGRFQDPDESAHYEYICKRAGIGVHYCAEQFENDASPLSSIIKSIKRAMAGEYSRELSVKVFAAQMHMIERGFRLGGVAGYGLRRVLVDQNGVPKCVLEPGQWKSITTDRIILAHGPAEEVEIVRWIYSMFVREGHNEHQIAGALNERGIRNHLGNPWKAHTVCRLLKNEKYIGNYIWNRQSYKLRKKVVRNEPGSWVRVNGVIPPMVDRSIFDAAQAIFKRRVYRTFRGRPRGLSDEEMIEKLTRVFQEHGKLSRHIIDRGENMPSCHTYKVRFGGLQKVYDLVGFCKSVNQHGLAIRDRPGCVDRSRSHDAEKMLTALKRLLDERGYLSCRVINACKEIPSVHAYRIHFGTVTRAYELIGYSRPYRTRPSLSDDEMLEGLRRLWKERGDLSRKIIQQTRELPSAHTYADRFGGLLSAYKQIDFKSRRLRLMTAQRGLTNEAMLEKLKALLSNRGYLTSRLIDQTVGMPSRSVYRNRFGSILQAYELIGYRPDNYELMYERPRGLSDKEMLDALRRLLAQRGRLSQKIMRASKDVPSHEVYYDRFGSLRKAYQLIGYKQTWKLSRRKSVASQQIADSARQAEN